LLYSLQMSAITLNLSDDLAERLRKHEDRLPEILELGLRELNAETQRGFEGAVEVLELLAALPSPEEIVRLKPSERLQRQVQDLRQKSRAGKLTPQEEEDWERYQFLEHLVRMAKTKAYSKLGISPGPDV
jgi:Na+-transporting NADH:ubiquinone oxidoreductase subunit NqrF